MFVINIIMSFFFGKENKYNYTSETIHELQELEFGGSFYKLLLKGSTIGKNVHAKVQC